MKSEFTVRAMDSTRKFCSFSLVVIFLTMANLAQSTCPTIISRNEWGARTAKTPVLPLRQIPPPYVVVHHSESPPCTTTTSCKSRVKGFQDYHMDHNGWQDIGYNFLIGGDGNVYEGRGWGKFGAHVPKFNSKSIGICVIGNFMKQKPSDTQLNTLKNLIACAKEKGHVVSDYKLIGHRQGKSTSCPGDKLYEEIETWPNFDSSLKRV